MRREKPVRLFVLVKDECRNLARCLSCWEGEGFDVTVLDSGSTDGSLEIARSNPGVTTVQWTYVNHAVAYNEILTRLASPGEWVVIVDADMLPTCGLKDEIEAAIGSAMGEVWSVPIQMWWAGHELRHGSLYPPKAVLFRAGRRLFEPSGHGERLVAGVQVEALRSAIIHDDRKPFSQTLMTQVRYGDSLAESVIGGGAGLRDRLRYWSPLFLLLTPGWSLFVKIGVLSGKVGWIYALDRLIAEAILHRQCMVRELERKPMESSG